MFVHFKWSKTFIYLHLLFFVRCLISSCFYHFLSCSSSLVCKLSTQVILSLVQKHVFLQCIFCRLIILKFCSAFAREVCCGETSTGFFSANTRVKFWERCVSKTKKLLPTCCHSQVHFIGDRL